MKSEILHLHPPILVLYPSAVVTGMPGFYKWVMETCSRGCPGTDFVDQDSLELKEICLIDS